MGGEAAGHAYICGGGMAGRAAGRTESTDSGRGGNHFFSVAYSIAARSFVRQGWDSTVL